MRPEDAHRASKISHRASKLGLAHAPLTGMPPAPAGSSWSSSLPLGGTGSRPSDSSSACDHSIGCWVGARSNYVIRPTGSALLRYSKPAAPTQVLPASPELPCRCLSRPMAAHERATQRPARPTPPGAQRRRTDRALPHLSPLARSHAHFATPIAHMLSCYVGPTPNHQQQNTARKKRPSAEQPRSYARSRLGRAGPYSPAGRLWRTPCAFNLRQLLPTGATNRLAMSVCFAARRAQQASVEHLQLAAYGAQCCGRASPHPALLAPLLARRMVAQPRPRGCQHWPCACHAQQQARSLSLRTRNARPTAYWVVCAHSPRPRHPQGCPPALRRPPRPACACRAWRQTRRRPACPATRCCGWRTPSSARAPGTPRAARRRRAEQRARAPPSAPTELRNKAGSAPRDSLI